MLLFAPLSGHHATLLRDTVRTTLRDFDVYVTDWVDARHGAALRRGRSTSTTTWSTCKEFIRLLGPELHGVGVPADRAGAGRNVAAGAGK